MLVIYVSVESPPLDSCVFLSDIQGDLNCQIIMFGLAFKLMKLDVLARFGHEFSCSLRTELYILTP